VLEVMLFSLDTGPWSFCHLFVALSIIPCLKSAQNLRCVNWDSLLLLWKPGSWFKASFKNFLVSQRSNQARYHKYNTVVTNNAGNALGNTL